MKSFGFRLCLVVGFTLSGCQSLRGPSEMDRHETDELTRFYGGLKVGDARRELDRLVGPRRTIECEGNRPGPQRCFVKFRVHEGEDLGASRMGITIQSATVKDAFKIVVLDYRDERLLRWELRDALQRRE